MRALVVALLLLAAAPAHAGALYFGGYSANLASQRAGDETAYPNDNAVNGTPVPMHVSVSASDLNGVCVALSLFVAEDNNGVPGTWKAMARFNIGWFSSVTRQPIASAQGWVPAGGWYKIDAHCSLAGAAVYLMDVYESVP